ncbi:SMP-30/gluconolactonase/LRE family protein [Kibdelosporangium philippinense]|uniref:SMP-30/gluconolactonase/LRE family protein n=1 Tax=Kibdelosporangium philippinense TaxID=211113 RepID=A0ABS8Z7A2_9PSEU|nr:SMP-30/gluconolactonase/LRE family protein [Kibdelosporangium philippinense]MCE7003765.1 SMP-30/gluconolactonase/LRE family protein [Kibdelosporangium philippinense]
MRFGEVTVIPVNGHGPEDVVVDADGLIYTGVDDGRILRITPDGKQMDVIGDTGGRPLGLELFGEDLLICDAKAGLLTMPLSGGTITTLATSALGLDFVFCNNAAVAQDGAVYFSDSSRRFGIENWRDDLIEQTASGRLLRRTPDGKIDLLADGLQFANGVALPPDESFVAVAETGAYQVRRVWLTGPRAGESDLLIGDLWGYPDNISTGSDGLIWVTIASPRVSALKFIQKLPAQLRAGVRALPTSLQPAPKREVGVLGVHPDGHIVHELRGEIDGFHLLVGVRERAGTLYFGSLEENAIAITTM